jgi:hypothetical protein
MTAATTRVGNRRNHPANAPSKSAEPETQPQNPAISHCGM